MMFILHKIPNTNTTFDDDNCNNFARRVFSIISSNTEWFNSEPPWPVPVRFHSGLSPGGWVELRPCWSTCRMKTARLWTVSWCHLPWPSLLQFFVWLMKFKRITLESRISVSFIFLSPYLFYCCCVGYSSFTFCYYFMLNDYYYNFTLFYIPLLVSSDKCVVWIKDWCFCAMICEGWE